MCPNLANITGLGNRYSTAANWLTNAIDQFKPFEPITWAAGIDVIGKTRAGRLRTFDRRERPNNQVVLHDQTLFFVYSCIEA